MPSDRPSDLAILLPPGAQQAVVAHLLWQDVNGERLRSIGRDFASINVRKFAHAGEARDHYYE